MIGNSAGTTKSTKATSSGDSVATEPAIIPAITKAVNTCRGKDSAGKMNTPAAPHSRPEHVTPARNRIRQRPTAATPG